MADPSTLVASISIDMFTMFALFAADCLAGFTNLVDTFPIVEVLSSRDRLSVGVQPRGREGPEPHGSG